jgi:aspartate oxidase
MELAKRMKHSEKFHYDVIVIGGGQAGLAAAISARETGASVAVITRGKAGFGGSSVISDGVHSAIFTKGDSEDIFFNDIIQGSRKLADYKLARILAAECTERVYELESKYGVSLEREMKVSTPGHSFPRRVYAGGGIGKNVTSMLRKYAMEIKVDLFEQFSLIDFLKDGGSVRGVFTASTNGYQSFIAPAVILATGGFGGLFASSDNPKDVTGDAIGLAWRHGARLVDMEFIQFYPYRLQSPANIDVMTRIFGKGAIMLNEQGQRFMDSFSKKELETRDILSFEMIKQKKVLLDLSNISESDLQHDSPYLYRQLKKRYNGEWLMSPVQHYCMGGIHTDENGRTNLQGLYAVGECAGGLHGSNRLGGGSLTEALVFGVRAGKAAANENHIFNEPELEQSFPDQPYEDVHELTGKVKDLMWNKAGIVRTLETLRHAEKELDLLANELENTGTQSAMLLHDRVRAAWASAFSASARKESRGAHKLQDLPVESEDWEGKLVIHYKNLAFLPLSSACKEIQIKGK